MDWIFIHWNQSDSIFLTVKSDLINPTENHRIDEKFDKVLKDNAILKRQIIFLKYRVYSMKSLYDNRLKSIEGIVLDNND